MDNYDVVVIGAGPGGYVAAIRCAQLGLKTACIERGLAATDKVTLGGTCLNVGCIPSKALLDSSHHYEHLALHAKSHGIIANDLSIDVGTMQKRKAKIVKTLTTGIAGLFKKNGVTSIEGSGTLKPDMKVDVCDRAGNVVTTIRAANIIVATGSVPAAIPPAMVDQQYIVDSTGALDFDAVPESLGVIGAGVIGLELGSVWRRLGSKVVIVEALPDFLGSADKDVAKEAKKLLGRQGLDIRLGSRVTQSQVADKKVEISYESADGEQTLTVDKLIVAVGRVPNTVGLGANEVGLDVDKRGFITVDENCRTNLEGIFAVGDVVRGPMLAHKASEEGIAVAERIAGQSPHVNLAIVPWVIYTWPEIAWVGEIEQDLAAQGRDISVGSFPFMASGRARAMGETDGFIKIIADKQSDTILGVHIIGPGASELIAEAVLAMEYGASAEDIARTMHAHPTLSEGMHEAALAVDSRPIHI
ncbi:MAG: dihydrolipoamide dehydrogenase [Gammaproteobacteria bacterium]|jgi:dihydrolipoamide dehydrogenase